MQSTRILILSPHAGDDFLLAEAGSQGAELREDECIGDVVEGIYQALSCRHGVQVARCAVESARAIEQAVRFFRPTAVFNLCETFAGQSRLEATVPWLLERLGVSFTGSPDAALRLCLHKFDANQVLARHGVRVPRAMRITHLRQLEQIRLPVIVKPDREDGSVGIDASAVARTPAELKRAVQKIRDLFGQPPVVEEYIEGRELTVSLLGYPEVQPLPLGEIAFDAVLGDRPKILTYAAKWDPESVEYIGTRSVPAALAPMESRRYAALGRRAFEALGLRDYGRVDLRVDAQGQAYVIDVNPNCDLSPDGGFGRALGRAGFRYEEGIWEVLRGALSRNASTRSGSGEFQITHRARR